MQENMSETNINNEYVGRYPFAIPNECVNQITKEGDYLLHEFAHILSQITSGEVECEDLYTLAGDSFPELSSTPENILYNLMYTKIELPDFVRESLIEWKDKIFSYTRKHKLTNEERDKVATLLVHLTHFLFEEVVNPALKNTYPSITEESQ